MFFSGLGLPVGARTDAGMTLVGQGTESATIKHEIIAPPDTLITGTPGVDGLDIVNIDEATPIQPISRTSQRVAPNKK
jgi:hypothetical protein